MNRNIWEKLGSSYSHNCLLIFKSACTRICLLLSAYLKQFHLLKFNYFKEILQSRFFNLILHFIRGAEGHIALKYPGSGDLSFQLRWLDLWGKGWSRSWGGGLLMNSLCRGVQGVGTGGNPHNSLLLLEAYSITIPIAAIPGI